MDPNTQPLQNKSLNDHSNNVVAPSLQQTPSVNDLVAAFEDSMKEDTPSVGASTPQNYQPLDAMSQKIADLKETDIKIAHKSATLKATVSEKLQSLKSLKNEIGGIIDEVKELEETRTRIGEEIIKLTTLAGEVSALEKEAESELK